MSQDCAVIYGRALPLFPSPSVNTPCLFPSIAMIPLKPPERIPAPALATCVTPRCVGEFSRVNLKGEAKPFFFAARCLPIYRSVVSPSACLSYFHSLPDFFVELDAK